MFPTKSLQFILLCLILNVGYSEEITLHPTTVNVTEHQSVKVTCTLNGSSDHLAVFDIGDYNIKIWTKNCSREDTIGNDNFTYGYQCPNNDTVVVTLKSVQQTSHLKTIMCSTKVRGVTMTSNNVTIYVTVPITYVKLNQTSALLKTREAKDTFLECVTSTGYPTSTIHWYKNDSKLSHSSFKTELNDTNADSYLVTTRSYLHVYPAREDNSSRFYCTASNTEEIWLYSHNVTMLVYYGPDKPTLSMGTNTINNTVKVISGRSLEIQCNSKCYPTPQYSWFTPNHSEVEGHILSVLNVTYPSSNGIYKCQVKVTTVLSTRIENETSVVVSVMHPPKPPLFLFNNDPGTTVYDRTLHVVIGDNFTVRCDSDSVPEPRYTWTGHENNECISSGNVSSDLIITSIRNDVMLTCTATNVMVETHGKTLTGSANSTLNISVLYPPQKPEFYVTNMTGNALEHKDYIDVIEGDTVVITCQAESRPKPDMYVWSSQPNINNASLEIKDAKATDAGTYSCKVHNTLKRTFGQQMDGAITGEVKLNVLGKPTSPLLFTTIEFLNTNSTITLSWEPSFDGGFQQVFVLRYRKVNIDEFWNILYKRDAGERDMTATLTSLSEGTVYEITIAARNEQGESAISGPLFVLTQGRRQHKQDVVADNCNEEVLIVGGTLGGAIIAGGVSIGLCFCRKYYITRSNSTKPIHQSATPQPSHTTYEELCVRRELGTTVNPSDKNDSVVEHDESIGMNYEEIRMSRLARGGEDECGQVELRNIPDVYENLKICS